MTQKKSIAIVSDAVYPFNKGGKEKRIYDISTRLAAEGHDVTIYCMKWWKGERSIVQNGVTLYSISSLHPLYSGNRRSITEALFFALNCLKLINKKFDVIEVDAIPHLALFSTKLVCLLKGKKMIVTWHEAWGLNYWRKYLGIYLGYIAFIIEITAAQLPNLIIAVSDHTAADLKDKLKTKRKIEVIRNGIDIESIIKNSPSELKSDVIFAGRLLAHKNVDVLLKSISIIKEANPDISLIIVGDGPERKPLQELVSKLNLNNNVNFVGFLDDHNELYSLMMSSKVFVLPSTREGFGIVVIEANACGLPFVTINHKGNATQELIIEGENGMISSLDENELAEVVKQSLRMNNDHKVYRGHAQKFNWNDLALKFKEIYAI